MTDRFGNEIKEGDVVVYAQGSGYTNRPQVAKVLSMSQFVAYRRTETHMRVLAIQRYGGLRASEVTLSRTEFVIKYDPALLDDKTRAVLGL